MKDAFDQGRAVREILTLTDQFHISFTENQALLCWQHIMSLLQWNRKVNLTRITSPRGIIAKHIMDSLIPASKLPVQGWVLDVGTGAGFPGIPLKILSPHLKVILLEKHRKKASFLKVTLSRLGLQDVWVVCSRWQDLPHSLPRHLPHLFDLITQRALRLDPQLLAFFCQDHLAAGGRFAFWAGPQPVAPESIPTESINCDVGLEQAFSYDLPWNNGRHRLLVWKRIGH